MQTPESSNEGHSSRRPALNGVDSLLVQFDRALRTLSPGAHQASRPSPASTIKSADTGLEKSEVDHAAGLMRVNHTGEVCAQALYQGQALTARLGDTRQAMEQAAEEEVDHLAWCDERLRELDSRPSYLNPAWYALSFGLGAGAGLLGDRWSLGFVAETEEQVCRHLEEHLSRLPENDERSRSVLSQMLVDERKHGESARDAGGRPLALPVRQGMRLMSGVMKKLSYRL